jgi:hypothetical protein
MAKLVPYLADEMIESDAALLLAKYAHARGIVIAPPIPIEDIVEKHLKLGIEFDDTTSCSACRVRASIPTSLLQFSSTTDASSSTRASIQRKTRRRKAAIATRRGMRLATGGCIAGCLAKTRRKPRFSIGDAPRNVDLPVEPSQGAGGAAGEPILFVPPDAAQVGPASVAGEATTMPLLRRQSRIVVPRNIDEKIAAAVRSFDHGRDDEVLEHFTRPFAEQFLVSPTASPCLPASGRVTGGHVGRISTQTKTYKTRHYYLAALPGHLSNHVPCTAA